MNNTKSNTLPKLVCQVTGKSRTSNIKYLEAKALRTGVTVDQLVNNYVSREAIKLLRKGQTVDQVRKELGVAEGFNTRPLSISIEELIRTNSKGKHS